MKQHIIGFLLLSGLAITSAQAHDWDWKIKENKRKEQMEKAKQLEVIKSFTGLLSCKVYYDADQKPVKTIWFVGEMPLSTVPPEDIKKQKGKIITLKGLVRVFSCLTCVPHETEILHRHKALVLMEAPEIKKDSVQKGE